MNQLISFEWLRMLNTKRVIFLVVAFFVTGLSGILLGSIYADKGMTAVDIFLFIINAFNQFVFVFVAYFYIISITNDFEHHIFFMYHQYGIPIKNVIMCKVLLNLLVSILCTSLFLLGAFFLLEMDDYTLLFSGIIEVMFAVIFSVLFSTAIAFLCRKTMLAFIINFICFIFFNVGNLLFMGVLSPADVNGLPFSAIRMIAEKPIIRDIEMAKSLPLLQTRPFLVLLCGGFICCFIIYLFLKIIVHKRQIVIYE